MSKIAIQKALKAYPPRIIKNGNNYDHNSDWRYIYIQGYDQSAKDTIARILELIGKIKSECFNDSHDDVFCVIRDSLYKLEKEYEQ